MDLDMNQLWELQLKIEDLTMKFYANILYKKFPYFIDVLIHKDKPSAKDFMLTLDQTDTEVGIQNKKDFDTLLYRE